MATIETGSYSRVNADADDAAKSFVGEAAPRWADKYARRLAITDPIVIAGAVLLAECFWGFVNVVPDVGWFHWTRAASHHSVASVVLLIVWTISLSVAGTRDPRVIGSGSFEYRRVLETSVMLFGLFAIVAVVLDLELGRTFVLTAFPLGSLALLGSRWAWRQWLGNRRRVGAYVSRALVIGSAGSVQHIVDEITRQPIAGYRPIAAAVSGRTDGTIGLSRVPVVGNADIDTVLRALSTLDVDCVVLASSDVWTPTATRRLGWALEETGTELIVAPALTDVAGPRMHTRPVAGLPLIHVESPVFGGRKARAKAFIDRVSAAVAIVLLSPILIGVAIAVSTTSKGPVLFRQPRIGLNGRTFTMFKFRSMRVDAEDLLEELRAQQRDAGNKVLFKMKNDPRVTKVGAFLRRYSLDELPQLFNVLNGSMSLVGPRPPLAAEVESYEAHNHRRFLVRPGITGLWQVSGRSDLSWEDSVRLDLYYVENWSVFNDIVLIMKTIRAVVRSSGAY